MYPTPRYIPFPPATHTIRYGWCENDKEYAAFMNIKAAVDETLSLKSGAVAHDAPCLIVVHGATDENWFGEVPKSTFARIDGHIHRLAGAANILPDKALGAAFGSHRVEVAVTYPLPVLSGKWNWTVSNGWLAASQGRFIMTRDGCLVSEIPGGIIARWKGDSSDWVSPRLLEQQHPHHPWMAAMDELEKILNAA